MLAATASAIIAATSAAMTASTWLLDRRDRRRTARDAIYQRQLDDQRAQAKQVAAWLPPSNRPVNPSAILVSNTSSMPIYKFRARVRFRALGELAPNVDPIGWIDELSPLIPPTRAGDPFSVPLSISPIQENPLIIEEIEWWEFVDAAGIAWRFGISTLQLTPLGGRIIKLHPKPKRIRSKLKGYRLSFRSIFRR